MSIERITDIFAQVLEQPGDRPLLTYRDSEAEEWREMTVREFSDGVHRRTRALHDLGVEPNSSIALISENRPEWHLYDFAILGLGASTVPIHANLSPEQTAYVLNDSESTHLIVSSEKLLNKVLTGMEGTGSLEKVIVLDPPDTIPERDVVGEPEILKKTESYSKDELASFWEEKEQDVEPHTLATLIYTSGTTGQPKGVMLTHRNIVSNLLSCYEVISFQEEDLGYSFLPLSHAFERLMDYAYLYCGSRIAYGSPDRVIDDLKEVQPTVFASVPRLFEKVKSTVEERLESSGTIKKTLFNWAMEVGYRATCCYHIEGRPVPRMLALKQWIANTFILRSVHNAIGGNVRMVVSGGAALDREVCEFLLGLSIPVVEGYGMTEMSPVVALNRPRSIRPGTVGRPLPEVDVQIKEDGEVITRGPNMMKGYYRKYDESVDALRDGWFHTGDVGELDEEGNLIIKGRAKYTIVTSWGENIIPQPLERSLRQSPFIEHVILIGHNRKFVSALIQPDFEHLTGWANENELSWSSRNELLKSDRLRDRMVEEIEDHQKDWADYEKVKAFRLIPETLTVKKGYLTPTMKVRRHILMDAYREEIDEMYEEDETESRSEL